MHAKYVYQLSAQVRNEIIELVAFHVLYSISMLATPQVKATLPACLSNSPMPLSHLVTVTFQLIII